MNDFFNTLGIEATKEEKKIKGKNKAGHQISKLKARESKKIYKKIDHWKSKKSSKQRKNKEIKL